MDVKEQDALACALEQRLAAAVIVAAEAAGSEAAEKDENEDNPDPGSRAAEAALHTAPAITLHTASAGIVVAHVTHKK